MRISNSGPMQPMQPMQRAAAQPKAEGAPQAEKPQAPPAAKDENKAKNFSDTPLRDVSSPFSAKSTGSADKMAALMAAEEELAAEAESEIDEGPEALTETAEAGETDEVDELEEAEESGEAEEAEEADDAGDVEASEEEGEGEGELEDGGAEAEAAEVQINLPAMLEMVAELRGSERFRVEETWALFAGQ